MKLDLTSMNDEAVGEPIVEKSCFPFRWVQFGRSMPEGNCHAAQYRESNEDFLNGKFIALIRDSFDKNVIQREMVSLKKRNSELAKEFSQNKIVFEVQDKHADRHRQDNSVQYTPEVLARIYTGR
jgi:hypothetical protein